MEIIMGNRAIQAMMRDPKKLMRYQTTGQLPSVKPSPATPLRNLIEQIPQGLRQHFKGITLHPSLGFNTAMQFHTLEQLHNWLGVNQFIVDNRSLPYMSWQIKYFSKELTVHDLIKHCSSYPTTSELERLPPRIR